MKKQVLILITVLICFNIANSQINIKGGVFSDSTLIIPLTKVKLILKSSQGRKTYWVDEEGKFDITIKDMTNKFSLEVKKKGYAKATYNDITQDMRFNIILYKKWTMGDEVYKRLSNIFVY